MKIAEIKEKVLSGELILQKTYMGKRTRNKYIWDKDGEHIIRVDKIKYDYWNHMAMLKNDSHAGYKINKKDYEECLKEKAK
jgi:hypothetical protein